MNFTDLKAALKNTGIEVAYREFSKPLPIPAIAFYTANERQYGADNLNLIVHHSVIVELYTKQRDMEAEVKVDRVLSGIEFEKSFSYLTDENLHMVVYEFELFDKKEEL